MSETKLVASAGQDSLLDVMTEKKKFMVIVKKLM